MTDPTRIVHAERLALVKDLEHLDAAAWQTPSLCEGWTVEDVLAHLTQRNISTPAELVAGAVRHRGLQKFIDAGIAEHRGDGPGHTLATFWSTATEPVPSTGALQAYYGELVIPAEDIRRPLGIRHTYFARPTGELLRTRGGLAYGLRRGLQLIADDADVTLGRGPAVHGPAISLLMCLSGRPAHLSDLRGDGLEEFARRLHRR